MRMSEQHAVEVEPCAQETLQHEGPERESSSLKEGPDRESSSLKEGPDRESSSLKGLRAEFRNKSWEDYINQFLIGSDHVTEAAIIEQDSGVYLASSSGFQLYEDEFAQILKSLSISELAYRTGVTVNDKFYKTRLADGNHGIFARTDSDGCTVCKTSTLVIIGIHDENCIPRRCNEEVMRLGDYLFAKGL